ncbi:transcriptional regulator [Pseudovibrio japonicus]|uniref:Transcriptional regulator n=1 Tax=Pseudovibrio japonicus TaxID=366534 RepID=A0ABQ3EJZ7_9HYPH|nr:GntR family transcriptional regulator [Pseudovibrio japonicus]GHB43732.1 transcriptional regulator [Pseudovibrio japonicus]
MSDKLYLTVFDAVVQRIVSGEYPPGLQLPNEFKLGQEFNVSQGTARKALIELEKKNIVQRRQGRGSFVTLQTPENSLFKFFRLRDENGNPVTPNLVNQTVLKRRATDKEQNTLYGKPKYVFDINRFRSFKNQPLSFENCVVSADLFPGLDSRGPLPNTLYVLFQQAYSIVVISAKDDITAEPLAKKPAEIMEMATGIPALVCRRKAFDILERVVELRTSIFVTKDMHYSVEM